MRQVADDAAFAECRASHVPDMDLWSFVFCSRIFSYMVERQSAAHSHAKCGVLVQQVPSTGFPLRQHSLQPSRRINYRSKLGMAQDVTSAGRFFSRKTNTPPGFIVYNDGGHLHFVGWHETLLSPQPRENGKFLPAYDFFGNSECGRMNDVFPKSSVIKNCFFQFIVHNSAFVI